MPRAGSDLLQNALGLGAPSALSLQAWPHSAPSLNHPLGHARAVALGQALLVPESLTAR